MVTTAVGYEGGFTPNPTYEEVVLRAGPATPRPCGWCSTRRGSPTTKLLKVFWEAHNPTQGMRQGNDVGTQYRSAIFYHRRSSEKQAAEARRAAYQERLTAAGLRRDHHARSCPAREFYFAEDYHQQYLSRPRTRTGTARTTAPAWPARCPVGLMRADG